MIISIMKTDRKDSEGFVRIGSIINKTLKTYRCQSDGELSKIWSLWNSAVGEAIAENAQPAVIRGKLLVVNVSSSTWIQQLQYLKKDMLKKINDVLGKQLVDEIKFKVGPVDKE